MKQKKEVFTRLESYINSIEEARTKDTPGILDLNFGKIMPLIAVVSDHVQTEDGKDILKSMKVEFNKCILSWQSDQTFENFSWGMFQELYIQLAAAENVFQIQDLTTKTI